MGDQCARQFYVEFQHQLLAHERRMPTPAIAATRVGLKLLDDGEHATNGPSPEGKNQLVLGGVFISTLAKRTQLLVEAVSTRFFRFVKGSKVRGLVVAST